MESLNAKISSSSKDFVNSIQNVGVYAYDNRDTVQAFRRVPANPDGAMITEDIAGYAEYFGSAQIEIGSAAATAVLADSTITPTEGLDGRHGWQFKNTVGGTAYDINYFDGDAETVSAGDLQSVYTRMFVDKFDIANQGVDGVNPEVPRIEVYTKPTGVGDFDPTYHSRWIYAVDTLTQHIGIFEDCVFYAIGGPSKRFGERTIPMNNVTLEGDGDLGGEILKIVVSSPTTAPAASIDVCVNMVGWENNSTTYPISRAYRLVYPAETGGDATAANQVLEIAELTQIATNTDKISKGSGVISAGGELQQVLLYGKKDDTTLQPLECSGDRLLVDVVELAASGQISNSTALSAVQMCGYDTSTSRFKTLKVDSNGVLETSGGGGGGGTQYDMGDALGATPTGTVALGRDSSGNAQALNVSASGDQFVELSNFVKGQTNMANSFPVNIASDQTDLNVSKMTQGYDATIASGGSGLQQNVVYGLDQSGNLDALRVDSSGHLEITVDDFVKGQDTMANSFPVNIASDQSRIEVDTVKDEVTISQVGQSIINPASFTSTAVDMRGYERISFFGTSTNTTDIIYILVSADDITYYTTGEYVTQDFTSGDFAYNATLGARYFKLQQASTNFAANFTITCISSKK